MPLFRVFPQHVAHQEPVTFEDLFRSVSQFSELAESLYGSKEASPFAHCQPKQHRSPQPRIFNPRFDIRETETAYELHGELPGVSKDNVHIEFTEPQTMSIRGRVERTFTSGTPAPETAASQEKIAAATEKAAITDSNDDAASVASSGSHTPAGSVSGHQASVSDEETEAARERGEEDFTIISNAAEDKKAPVAANKEVTAPAAAATKPTERFWRQERTVGEFHRQFVFSDRIDESAVTASLDNGILRVNVPKVKREVRRIAVF
jgi:HSP20 family molecular chaperone IbpA